VKRDKASPCRRSVIRGAVSLGTLVTRRVAVRYAPFGAFLRFFRGRIEPFATGTNLENSSGVG
jgi:hypothetical protein